MKSIHEHIDVDAAGSRVPHRFRWEGRTYRIRRLLDYWILQTRWWGREEKRIYYRLETNRGIVEVYRAAELRAGPDVRSMAGADSSPAFTERPPRPNGRSPFADGPSSFSEDRSPFPIEGDTHTRERRLTDAAYRPDVRIDQAPSRRAASSNRPHRVRWVLSKIMD